MNKPGMIKIKTVSGEYVDVYKTDLPNLNQNLNITIKNFIDDNDKKCDDIIKRMSDKLKLSGVYNKAL
jgi:hypothetical protein